MRIWLTFITCVLVVSLCLLSTAGRSSAARRKDAQTKEAKAAARKAWPAFFAKFRAAVRRRDRDALREMMAGEFNGPPNTPEDAFRQWDDSKGGGWVKLRRVLAQGAVWGGDATEGDTTLARPAMISPPATEKRGYRGWYVLFEFQEDGKWRCLQFTPSPLYSH